jgi:hypothetical protein
MPVSAFGDDDDDDTHFSDVTGDPRATGGRRRRSPRRPRLVGALVTLLLLAVATGGLWLVGNRQHVDDVAAYDQLAGDVELVDRGLFYLQHSEVPPCRDGSDGTVTRTYPPSTGPSAAELVGALTALGWTRASDADVAASGGLAGTPSGQGGPTTLATMTRGVVGQPGRVVTVVVTGRSLSALPDRLVGTSTGSAVGCLFH